MDSAQLLAVLEGTFDPEPNRRHEAETYLAQLGQMHGFSTALLQVVATANLNLGVRQAGAIYFKNMVVRSWSVPEPLADEPKRFEISAADKDVARTHLLDTIAHAPVLVRRQLLRAVAKVVECDYPAMWPDLVPKVCAFLTSGVPSNTFAGLHCLLELMRKYEYKRLEDLGPLEPVIASTYPLMLTLLSQCVANPTPEGGDAIRLIGKIVHVTIAFNLPKPLRQPSTLEPWIRALLHIVSLPLPADPVQRGRTEQYKFSWWFAKKWACLVLNDLFTRYGNETVADHIPGKKERRVMKEFGKAFFNQIVPSILDTYLKQLDLVRQGHYCAPRVMHAIMSFMSDALAYGATWKRLKPFVIGIVREDQEKWDEDPVDFIRSQFDIDEDLKSPQVASRTFLYKLVSARKDQALAPILQFCQEILTRYLSTPPESRNYTEKDGVLNIVKSLSSILADREDMTVQLEQLMLIHVLPEIDSHMPFLRMRAVDVVGCLAGVHFPNPQTLMRMLQTVLPHLGDPELPVVTQASLTMGSLIDREELSETIQPLVGQIMMLLLKLQAEYELEEASFVMDKMIESFAESMVPFAEPLCASLCENFVKLVQDSAAELPVALSNDEEDYSTKGITAMATMRSLLALVRAMDETSGVLLTLQRLLVPVIEFILKDINLDFLEDACELASALTYMEEPLTPETWRIFDLLYHAFKNGAIDFFKEMLPVLDNLVSHKQQLLEVPTRIDALMDMIGTVMTSPNLGEEDRASGCIMMEVIMQNLRGHVDHLIPTFILSAWTAYGEADYRHLIVTSLKAVLNAIYSNATLALNVLQSNNLLIPFFTAWNVRIKLFNRVCDKKMCIIAMCAIYELPFDSLPLTLQDHYHHTLDMLVEVFKTLPNAYEVRKAYEEYYENGDTSSDEDEDDGEVVDGHYPTSTEETDPDGDAIDKQDEEYMKMIARKLKKLSPLTKLKLKKDEAEDQNDGDEDEMEGEEDDDDEDEDDDEDDEEDGLDEELLVRTPLDSIDEYIVFLQTFQGLPLTNPKAYGVLSQHLTPDRNTVFTEVFSTANEHLRQQQQQQPQ